MSPLLPRLHALLCLKACMRRYRRYAMKTLEKAEMLERNKVMRVLTEARILAAVDHPFLASLYGTIATDTHLHFLMQICEGGELYALLTSQPSKRFKESHVRFYTSEVGCSGMLYLCRVSSMNQPAARRSLSCIVLHSWCL